MLLFYILLVLLLEGLAALFAPKAFRQVVEVVLPKPKEGRKRIFVEIFEIGFSIWIYPDSDHGLWSIIAGIISVALFSTAVLRLLITTKMRDEIMANLHGYTPGQIRTMGLYEVGGAGLALIMLFLWPS